MGAAAQGKAPFRILVVCTANICRSVMAERFLIRAIAARGVRGATVGSCGLLFDDEPASDPVIAVLDEMGIDARDHRSRKCTPEILADADLVVTMERRHARELAVSLDGVSPRIHTLGGLVDGLAGLEDASGTPAERVGRVSAGREASALLGSGPDEVADPHGRPTRVHRKAAARLEELANALLDGLYGPGDAG